MSGSHLDRGRQYEARRGNQVIREAIMGGSHLDRGRVAHDDRLAHDGHCGLVHELLVPVGKRRAPW
jgi:hypothetical protein